MPICPRCGTEATELISLPPALAAKLQASGQSVPGTICTPCISELKNSVTRAAGGVLLAQERAAEQHRLHLWKSRVLLIKKARALMAQKMYADAAVSYEKYLKILQIVFQCKKGEQLTPDMFKESARTSELTVVASVYWDLLRIYDTHERYAERQMTAAKQLAAFVRYTPIFPDVIKRAEAFVKQAKKPEAVKHFLKKAVESRPRCFIATSAFESPLAVEVQILRHFRDNHLRRYFWGRNFIHIYYRNSPKIAAFLDRYPSLKPAVRALLRAFINCAAWFSRF